MSNQSPAEALRQQIQKLEVPKMVVWVDKEMKVETTNLVDKTVDEIMELVTAYAATVEREAADQAYMQALKDDTLTRVKRLEAITVRANDEAQEIVARLAALQGPQGKEQ